MQSVWLMRTSQVPEHFVGKRQCCPAIKRHRTPYLIYKEKNDRAYVALMQHRYWYGWVSMDEEPKGNEKQVC
jgi:hypothetical protein